MRHFLSLLAGLLIAPVVWIAAGFGQVKLQQSLAADGGSGRGFSALAILCAAGLLIGLVASTRVSPLGPVFAGALLLGGQAVYVWRPSVLPELGSTKLLGVDAGDILAAPAATGLVGVVGTAMLVALLSIGRWRKWPKFTQPDDAFLSDGAAPIGSPTPPGARPYGADDPLSRPDEPTRAFAGAGGPSGSDPGRYEAFGYISDEPTRPAPPWPDSPAPAWRSDRDLDDSESTTRLPGGDPGPWAEPPRR